MMKMRKLEKEGYGDCEEGRMTKMDFEMRKWVVIGFIMIGRKLDGWGLKNRNKLLLE